LERGFISKTNRGFEFAMGYPRGKSQKQHFGREEPETFVIAFALKSTEIKYCKQMRRSPGDYHCRFSEQKGKDRIIGY
jgi:hypothetical protein